MGDDRKKPQPAPPTKFLTTSHLKRTLQDQALALAVGQHHETLSMTTGHLQKRLAALAKDQRQSEAKKRDKANSK